MYKKYIPFYVTAFKLIVTYRPENVASICFLHSLSGQMTIAFRTVFSFGQDRLQLYALHFRGNCISLWFPGLSTGTVQSEAMNIQPHDQHHSGFREALLLILPCIFTIKGNQIQMPVSHTAASVTDGLCFGSQRELSGKSK